MEGEESKALSGYRVNRIPAVIDWNEPEILNGSGKTG